MKALTPNSIQYMQTMSSHAILMKIQATYWGEGQHQHNHNFIFITSHKSSKFIFWEF